MTAPDYDETVFVDEDGRSFTRREYPAIDFPPGTRVCLAGVGEVKGVVVDPGEPSTRPGVGTPMKWVKVQWIEYDWSEWRHVDGLERVE